MSVDAGFMKIALPRLGLFTQDKWEGKGKTAKVIAEAGVFYTDVVTDEQDEETGKNIYKKTEIGKEVEGVILYQRKQLRSYDEATEKYTSSPIFDNDNEQVILFCDKQQVFKGLPADLKKEFMYTDKQGKKKSSLEENKILYVLVDGVLYQMTVRGSSLWGAGGYSKYASSHIDENGQSKIASFLTRFSSVAREKGDIAWNQMTCERVRDLTSAEAEEVLAKKREILEGIKAEKDYYGANEQIEAKKVDRLANYGKDEEDTGDFKPGVRRLN
jgi:hypothetical protein